ncbi:MAG: hypothetical protein M3Y08_01230 [Fibrobacterota bacterium]|nr:hypothetical protein [Fibrobacterota bacterium]
MPRPSEEIEIVQDQDFQSQNVGITSRIFINCTFKDCNLFHYGGGLSFQGCQFDNVKWIAAGPLALALTGKPAATIVDQMKTEWNKVTAKVTGPSGVDDQGNIKA